MGGGDGQAKVGGDQYSEGGAELDAKAGRRRDEREVLAERLHHAAAQHAEAEYDPEPAVEQNPDGRR